MRKDTLEPPPGFGSGPKALSVCLINAPGWLPLLHAQCSRALALPQTEPWDLSPLSPSQPLFRHDILLF